MNRVLLLAVVAVFGVLVGMLERLGQPHIGAFAQAADLVGVPGQFQELLSGTGFFIAYDGRLLTAAHVVNGCERVDIASPSIPPTRVETLMVHPAEDIALLMARQVVPKAILRYGGPSPRASRLFVLGYPGTGDLLKASETWADLANPRFNNPGLDARGALLMRHAWLERRPGDRSRVRFRGRDHPSPSISGRARARRWRRARPHRGGAGRLDYPQFSRGEPDRLHPRVPASDAGGRDDCRTRGHGACVLLETPPSASNIAVITNRDYHGPDRPRKPGRGAVRLSPPA
jgi:hypothetical protein